MRKLVILGAFLVHSLPGFCQQDTTNRYVTVKQLTDLRTYIGTLPYEQANPMVTWCNQVYTQLENPEVKKETKKVKEHTK